MKGGRHRFTKAAGKAKGRRAERVQRVGWAAFAWRMIDGQASASVAVAFAEARPHGH
jgi:hypothetical protein